jgi:hypothetical protein
LRASASFPFDLLARDPLRSTFSAGYSLPSGAIQNVEGVPALTANGRAVRVARASLSADEGGANWITAAELVDASDFVAFSVGDPFTLTIGPETWQFIVDGKSEDRSVGGHAFTLSGVSPLALLDSPFAARRAFSWSAPTLARQVVEEALGAAVVWSLPDWPIPADLLTFSDATPLGVARAIVDAIGGRIESAPDGSVNCRPTYPVDVPDYATATPAHVFKEGDVFSVSERLSPSEGVNRLVISNETGSDSSDLAAIPLEYVPINPLGGIVRAEIRPPRDLLLATSAAVGTVSTTPRGVVTRTEVEVIEMVEGLGATRYPVDGIVSTTWQATDLGAVTADGRRVYSDTPGYSLLEIKYTTWATEWVVASTLSQDVLFYLVES